ncbi:MAG: hypothetical protein MI794_05870 [Pseudomonadales bacterium]|nr:hypothetical protein [Pseudomonadales bacterium]
MESREIYRQGLGDYFKYKGCYHNPYPSGSQEFDDYEQGWMQSHKRSPKLFPQGKGYQRTFAERYKDAPHWQGPGDSQD